MLRKITFCVLIGFSWVFDYCGGYVGFSWWRLLSVGASSVASAMIGGIDWLFYLRCDCNL